ncbi:hypothetical protein HXX76_011035 [Chlamydomonas incerta]|uniref:BACK domain-containing protein n=1 Tax=Chlamydomonas incerta TaxID=51695 RepID=A0A835VY28_CHLIN|nr:hypothetical protein HXX76_011035 [Chlamydomonas incerta]|eukprot:KAG2429266.1 hypothetical protein HXX76_011035 [Chlamydomonas incerta]
MAPQQPGATAPVNSRVAEAISGLFGQREGADCQLVFVLDPAPPTGFSAGGGAVSGSGATRKKEAATTLGGPLPAHSFVLRYASDKIAAQLKWPETGGADSTCAHPSNKAPTSVAAAKAAAPQKQLPEVQLMLGGEEELPAARAAIQFAYTGRVQAGISVREALQVRRQAAYLQIGGCMEACLEVVKEALVQGSAGNAAASSSNVAGLELFRCAELWPDTAEDAAFAALLETAGAKRQLVAHFGDALAVLNDMDLYEQMVTLPAQGLEALLESDDFSTDSESSVVLVLAEWMAANYSRTDEALRRRLCGLLRLMQCSRTYLCGVLPVLAARHQRSPTSAAGWFPMTQADATCMVAYSTAWMAERKEMAAEGTPRGPCAGMPAGWLSTQPRRQCLPAEGRSFTFSTSLTEMETFGALKPGEKGYLYPRFPGSLGSLRSSVAAQGLRWQPVLQWTPGASTAAVFFKPCVPAALAATITFGTAAELLTGAVVAFPRMRVSVRGAAGKQAWSSQYGDDCNSVVRIGCALGWSKALNLHEVATNQQPSSSNGGTSSTRSNRNSKVAACWASYLQDGTRLESSMVLLPRRS